MTGVAIGAPGTIKGVEHAEPVCIKSPRYGRIANPSFGKVARGQEPQIPPIISRPQLTLLRQTEKIRHVKRLGPAGGPGNVLREFEHGAVPHIVAGRKYRTVPNQWLGGVLDHVRYVSV